MKFSLFKEYGALNSKPVFEAFEQSLVAAGHTVCESDMHCDVAVIWSVLWNGRMSGNKPVWDYYRKTGRNVVVLEIGGIHRGTTWKVGINGINRNAYFGPTNNNENRATRLGLKLSNWKDNGEFVLLCGQHNKSLQWQDMPIISNWVIETIDTIRQYTERPIIFRPHPRCPLPHIERGLKNVYRQDPVQISGSYDNFDLAFSRVWTTVSWSSNPGPQSVIAGIPAIVGPGSLAWDVATQDFADIENPAKPDRAQWLNDYAYTEWTVDEIRQGLPLKRLTPKLENVTI
jgi:hypothetical protein